MSQSDNGFDLSGVRDAAAQALTTESQPPVAEPAAAPVESGTQQTPPVALEAAAEEVPAQPTPEAAPPPFDVTLTHRGKTVRVTDPDEAKALMQKGYDYTVKTTEVADAKRALEAKEQAWLAREQQIVEFLQDDSRVAAYLAQRRGQAPPAPASAAPAVGQPDDLLTVAQVQQLMDQERQRLHAELQQELSQVRNQIPQVAELVQTRQAWAQDVEAHLSGLQQKYPELQAVEDFNGTMKARMRDYLQQHPVGDLDTAKAIIAGWAQSQAQKIRSVIDTHTKQTVVKQAQAKATIAPPGGRSTTGTAASSAGLKVGDPRLTEMVVAALGRRD